MKKQIIALSVIIILTEFTHSVNAQTLYIPSGTSGIGSSSGTPNTNIGFGTSTPNNYLAGTNGITLFGTYPGLAFATSTKTWLLYKQSDNSFRLWENTGVNVGIDRITVLSGGNVGIGVASPIQTLDINGRINLRNGVIQNGGAAITSTSDLGLYSLNAGYYMRFVTNNAPIRFYSDGNPTSNTSLLSIESNGKVLIGNPATVTLPDGYKLYVETGILSERVKVAVKTTANWSDYVFGRNYKLKSIEELEKYFQANKHLPNIPSGEDIVKNGLDVATMDAKLLEKIEELTLYIVGLNKRVSQLEKENKELKK